MERGNSRPPIPAALLRIVLLLCFSAGVVAADDLPLWRYVTGGVVIGAPALDRNGGIYLPAEDRYVHALTASGERRWRFELAGIPTTPAVLGADGTVFVATRKQRLYGIAPDGRHLFSQTLDASVQALAVTRNGTLGALLDDATLLLSTDRGRALFSVPLSLDGPGELLATDGRWFVTGARGRVTAINGGGQIIWTRSVGSGITAAALDARGALLLGTRNGELLRLSGTTEPRRVTRVQGPVVDIRTVTDRSGGRTDAVLLRDQSGRVYLLSGEATGDGALQWRAKPPGAPVVSAALTDVGTLLLLTADGRIRVMSRSGRVTEQYHLPQAEGPMQLTARDGQLLVTDRSWVTAAFPLTDGAHGGWRGAYGPPDNSRFLRGRENQADSAWWEEQFDFIYLRDHLFAAEERDRERAMEEIRRRVEDDALQGDYPYIVELLTQFALEPYRTPRYEDGRLANDFPDLRFQAVSLLNQLPSSGRRTLYLRLLQLEYNMDVKAAAARGLAMIGTDPAGAATELILKVLRSQDPNQPHAGFVAAALTALESLGARGGSAEAVTEAVQWIRASNAPADLRRQASDLLRSRRR
jgi:outer membrane protein assembly factor BamB